MKRESLVVIAVMVAFMLQYAFILTPESLTAYRAFLFDDTLIYKRTYFDYLFKDIANLIYVGVIFNVVDGLKRYRWHAFIVMYCYLFDYALIYNNPFYGVLSYAWVVCLVFTYVLYRVTFKDNG